MIITTMICCDRQPTLGAGGQGYPCPPFFQQQHQAQYFFSHVCISLGWELEIIITCRMLQGQMHCLEPYSHINALHGIRCPSKPPPNPHSALALFSPMYNILYFNTRSAENLFPHQIEHGLHQCGYNVLQNHFKNYLSFMEPSNSLRQYVKLLNSVWLHYMLHYHPLCCMLIP